jgi:predicted cobalt transporter CbtA
VNSIVGELAELDRTHADGETPAYPGRRGVGGAAASGKHEGDQRHDEADRYRRPHDNVNGMVQASLGRSVLATMATSAAAAGTWKKTLELARVTG